MLEIKDLRFHDLRHEAASYWFECGFPIQWVAQITGHRSWSTLQRYTHLYEFGEVDKYAGWRCRPTNRASQCHDPHIQALKKPLHGLVGVAMNVKY